MIFHATSDNAYLSDNGSWLLVVIFVARAASMVRVYQRSAKASTLYTTIEAEHPNALHDAVAFCSGRVLKTALH